MQQWICSKLTCWCLVVEVIEIAICWCERLLCPTDLWICRNILEIESQKENNNQKHWTAKYVLPFQWWQGARWCACQINSCCLFNFFVLFFVPKGFNWGTGPHWSREHCDGRQWAPARGTGTGTAWLRVTCILKAATVTWWHNHFKLNPADGGRYQGRFKLHASVSTAALKPATFQVAACQCPAVPESHGRPQAHCTRQSLSQSLCWVGPSWGSNPGPCCGRHGRRRGLSGAGAADKMVMYTNNSLDRYPVFVRCALAVQR